MLRLGFIYDNGSIINSNNIMLLSNKAQGNVVNGQTLQVDSKVSTGYSNTAISIGSMISEISSKVLEFMNNIETWDSVEVLQYVFMKWLKIKLKSQDLFPKENFKYNTCLILGLFCRMTDVELGLDNSYEGVKYKTENDWREYIYESKKKIQKDCKIYYMDLEM